ncbi:MAG: phosphohistidine phosphatase SixA [Methanoregulaceae archaeon]|jgi:phosphohistidine phosphatase|nr:phosphohistidine phosphatase SixA [Methanoregulaceae archaeon]
MDLYILRHGKAGRRDGSSTDDRKRPLTAKGRKEMEEIALWIASSGIEPDWIATSPLVRARETAEIVARTLGLMDRLEEWEELAFGPGPEAILGKLSAKGPDTRGMVVGHEPLLSETIAILISSDGSARIALAKGGLAKIREVQFDPSPSGELEWLVPPKFILRS